MEWFTPPHCFETPDAVARPLMLKDASSLFEDLYGDPAVMRNMADPVHTSIEESKALIRYCMQHWDNHSMHVWGIESKATRRLLGYVKLQAALPRVEFGIVSVQKPHLQRRRIYFDMCLRILDWLIVQPSVHYVYAYSDIDSPSEQFFKHIGFQHEVCLPNWDARPNRGIAAVPIHLYGSARPFTPFVHFLHHTWFRKPEHAHGLHSRYLLEEH